MKRSSRRTNFIKVPRQNHIFIVTRIRQTRILWKHRKGTSSGNKLSRGRPRFSNGLKACLPTRENKMFPGHGYFSSEKFRDPASAQAPAALRSCASLASHPSHSNPSLSHFASLRVAGLGIEPRLPLSESDVLPLDDPAVCSITSKLYQILEILHFFFTRNLHLSCRHMRMKSKLSHQCEDDT